MVLIDIACTTAEDARQAVLGGANSIEVSVDLAADGLTPPVDLLLNIYEVLEYDLRDEMTQIDIHLILRPHNRGFVYTDDEKQTMLKDAQALAMACDGFVIGGLLDTGAFDVEWIRTVAEAFPEHKLTLHRALDHCTNPIEALEALQDVCHRVLATGSLTTAWEGRETLRAWVQQFGEHYSFVAAGHVNHETIAALIAETGVHECHAARAVRREGVVAADLVRSLHEKTL